MSLASKILCSAGLVLAMETKRRHRFLSENSCAYHEGGAAAALMLLRVYLSDCSKPVRREVGAAMRAEFGRKG